MSTHTALSYHIVFSTKNRTPVLKPERRDDLFRYVWGIIKNRRSHLYRINGVEDHLHILSSLHPTVSLADFVKEVTAQPVPADGTPQKDRLGGVDQREQSVQKLFALAGGIRRLYLFPARHR